MIPDLGQYAGSVFAAYAATIGLLAVLVGQTWRNARRVRGELSALEAKRRKGNSDGES